MAEVAAGAGGGCWGTPEGTLHLVALHYTRHFSAVRKCF